MGDHSITINPEDIKNNPMNNSTSKMLYSFPKDKRFPKEALLDTPYYTLPNIASNRATSMGFGNKTSFEDIRGFPSPDKYKVKGDFDQKGKHGPSFGIGRQEARASSLSMFNVNSIPGPGAYNPLFKQHKRAASVRSRTKDHSLDQQMKVPGPGQYNTNQSTIYGKIYNSRFQSVKSSVMSKAPVSLQPIKSKSPTPWTYSPIIMTRKGGKSMINSKAYRFSQSRRLGFEINNKTPGPGQYNSFSQFTK